MNHADLTQSSRVARLWPLAAMLVILIAAARTGAEEEGKEQKGKDAVSPEAAIRATAQTFVDAFNRGDAPAIAALWTPNGSLSDDRGGVFKGRKAIEAEYAALFKQFPGARMQVAVTSVEFPAATMALEEGIAQVVAEHAGPLAASRYTAVHVLEDGKWLMATVRDSDIQLPSNFPRMQELGWLIGTWEARSGDVTLRASFRWVANNSFIQREHTVRQGGVVLHSGVQIIGWDPAARQVRSWSFDSSGGYGTGLWTPTPEGWSIESHGLLPDGTPTSSRDFVIRVPGEENVVGWRSAERTAGEATLPDLREIVLDRVPDNR